MVAAEAANTKRLTAERDAAAFLGSLTAMHARVTAHGDIEQRLDEGGGFVKIRNFMPEAVAEHALASIGRQDYPAELVEVVIVDDSPAALRVDGLAAGAQRVGNVSVVYVVLSEQRSIGAKRNEAVRRATGEVAVHWDDDDIFAEGRLRAQVAPIVRGEADVTLLEHQLTYFMDRDELYAAAMPWKEDVSTWGPPAPPPSSPRRCRPCPRRT